MPASPTFEIRARPGQPLGMSPAHFLRDYWQKHPLLVRGAFPAFEPPLQPEDLAGLACEELALSRIVVHDPRRDAWSVRNGPFAESDFAGLPKTHWTLLVQDVDKWDADVADLPGHFAFLPAWRIDDVMVSYAEDGGSVGAHVDQYDVFLLQGLGRRRWQVDSMRIPRNSPHIPVRASQPEAEEFRDDTELKLLREFTPTHEWVLEPGDMLYLPPGMPHHGVALGACMTFSIGMRAPSQAELAGDFIDYLIESLPDDARYGDPDLVPGRGDGEIDEAAIGRVVSAMPWLKIADDPERGSAGGAGGVAASSLRTWFGCFITRYRSAQVAAAPPRRIGDAALERARTAGASVRRNPWSRFAWMREGRNARLFVAGGMHECSIAFARAACSQMEFELATATTADDRAVLRTLLDGGHLALPRTRTSR